MRLRSFVRAAVAALALALAAPRVATAAPSRADSVAVVRTVDAFHGALARGDSAAALRLFAPDLVVIESGDVERYADYRRHHLPADIEFARAVPSTRSVTRVAVDGNTAWLAATSDTKGEFKGRPVSSVGAELIVLTRDRAGAQWRIRAIHWSSRRRPAS